MAAARYRAELSAAAALLAGREVHVRVARDSLVEHLAELGAAGWTMAANARAAGVSSSTVSLAARGRPVWWSTMRRLVQVAP